MKQVFTFLKFLFQFLNGSIKSKESKSEYAGKLKPVLVKNVKEKLML